MALGQRENLRWNKFSSFILTTCSSSAGRNVSIEAALETGGNRKKIFRQIRRFNLKWTLNWMNMWMEVLHRPTTLPLSLTPLLLRLHYRRLNESIDRHQRGLFAERC